AAIDNNNVNEQVTVSAASPTITTVPTPTTVTLGASPVTLTDLARLANGFNPTGSITFTLVAPGGATVATETVKVNGNWASTTPTAYPLPRSRPVTRPSQSTPTPTTTPIRSAAIDNNNVNEQVTVSAASPTIFTAPTPTTVTLGASPVTLTDLARLANGF